MVCTVALESCTNLKTGHQGFVRGLISAQNAGLWRERKEPLRSEVPEEQEFDTTRLGLDPSSRAGLGVANDKSPDFAEEFLFNPRVIE